MRIHSSFIQLFLGLSFLLLSANTFASYNSEPLYEVAFTQPANVPYHVIFHVQQRDKTLYLYSPVSKLTNYPNMIIFFLKGATTVEDGIQTIVSSLSRTKPTENCQNKKISVTNEAPNIFIMTASFTQCEKPESITRFFKGFNMRDGLYVIGASIQNTDSNEVQVDIEKLVKTATITYATVTDILHIRK